MLKSCRSGHRRLLAWAVILVGILVPARPTAAADLEVLEPKDRTVVQGQIRFRIKPSEGSGERVIASPEISVEDELGNGLITLPTLRSPTTGICSVVLDSTRLRDGLYRVKISYKALRGEIAELAEEWLTLGVRNARLRPARFLVDWTDRVYPVTDGCELRVTVLDARGKPFVAARVTVKAEGGGVDADAWITDADGEAIILVDSETAGSVTVTITVEGLPPVKRVVRFG